MVRKRGRITPVARHGDIGIFDVAYGGDSVLDMHSHGHANISVLVAGAYTGVHGDAPRYCTPGTAVVHPPHERHADYFVAPSRSIEFDFPPGASRASLLNAARATYPHLAGTIARALDALSQNLQTDDGPAWLYAVLRDFRWVEPVPISEAARLADTHPTHFARSFRKHVGMTPGRYRRRERIRAASQLLLASSASLSDVAYECGFTDQSHLTNVFCQDAGIPPKRFRAAFAR